MQDDSGTRCVSQEIATSTGAAASAVASDAVDTCSNKRKQGQADKDRSTRQKRGPRKTKDLHKCIVCGDSGERWHILPLLVQQNMQCKFELIETQIRVSGDIPSRRISRSSGFATKITIDLCPVVYSQTQNLKPRYGS